MVSRVNQFELDHVAAFNTAWKKLSFSKSDLVGQPMLLMNNSVNSTFGNFLASFESWRCHKSKSSPAKNKDYSTQKANDRSVG